MSEDDLFGSSSDEGGDTDDLIADSKKEAPVATKKKRLQKKAAPPAKKRKLPDADNDDDDDDDDLFADSDDEKPAGKPLSKKEKMDALQNKKRQVAAASQRKKKKAMRMDSNEGADGEKEKGYDSGDSYNSGTYQRTADDNDFIDVDGDDQDAINELYAEQHFDDERPDGEDEEEDGRRKKKGSGSSRPRARGPDAVSDDDDVGEDGEPQNPIMAAVHKMKKKKRVAPKITELEDEAKEFISRMENAADDDEQAVKAKRPATQKLKMLGEVLDMLTRRDMMRLLLDLDVLAACKRWIQPLPNGSLGNVTVRQRILETIGNMTGEQGIISHDLKRSGIGQTIMVLFKHKSETPTMKRAHKKLIEQWSRPIFQKSGNMRDLEHAQSTRRTPSSLTAVAAMRSSPKPEVASGRRNKKDVQSLIVSGRGAQKEGMNRVRVPYSKGFQYTVRPQGKTGDVADARMVRGGAPKDNRGNLSKRMLEKGRLAGKNQRSADISIVGRPTK